MSASPSLQVQQQPMPRHPSPKGSKQSLSPLNFSPGGGPTEARSPSSIPSSPTSVHSMSSAIFERDIEVPGKLSPNHAGPLLGTSGSSKLDAHHTARAVAHEPLENAVPSVLTAAVAALGDLEGSSKDAKRNGGNLEEISVIAPSPNNWQGGSAARYGASRSPSPHSLPLPLPGAAVTSSASSVSGASTPGSSPSRMGTRQSTFQQQSLTSAMAGTALSPLLITTSLTPATDPNVPHVADSNVASRGSTPGVGIVPPTPNANTFSFAAINRGSTSPDTAGSPPSATASPMVMTPPLPMGTRRDGSRNTSRPTSVATSLYGELSLAPLLVTSGIDEVVGVPPDVEPIAFNGNMPHPPSPQVQPALRENFVPQAASKRLSFVSYNDLLNSTPTPAFPLSNLTSASPNVPEPPHQIEVSVGRAGSRNSTMNISPTSDVFGSAHSVVDGSSMEDVGGAGDLGLKGGHGGEWERGGFGTGMEERLEAAMKEPTSTTNKD